MKIDTNFDFRSDSSGQDPDFASPTLKCYHKLLWSKNLPSEQRFKLEVGPTGKYLFYQDKTEKHYLTSDSIVNSYASRKNPPKIEIGRAHV